MPGKFPSPTARNHRIKPRGDTLRLERIPIRFGGSDLRGSETAKVSPLFKQGRNLAQPVYPSTAFPRPLSLCRLGAFGAFRPRLAFWLLWHRLPGKLPGKQETSTCLPPPYLLLTAYPREKHGATERLVS